MKYFKILSLLFIPLLLFNTSVVHAYTDRNIAIVRILNKAAGKSETLRLPIGQSVQYEKIKLFVNSCKQTDPFQVEDFFMFISIKKSNDTQIFSGWMTRNEPGDNPLQDADYDVWLTACE